MSTFKLKRTIFLAFLLGLIIIACAHAKRNKKRKNLQNSEATISTRENSRRHHKRRHMKTTTILTTVEPTTEHHTYVNLTEILLITNATEESTELGKIGTISKVTTEVISTSASSLVFTTDERTTSMPCSGGKGEFIKTLTALGEVRGRVIEVLPSKKVNVYRGIKYGKAPVGSRRFKHPMPAEPWESCRDALEYAPTCVQWRDMTFNNTFPYFKGTEMWNPNTKTSEDCLYLNVWAPHSSLGMIEKYSVMVWIYGGGYYSGTSSLDVYDGKWLAATQNVIVVSMNYRIGALGFLATGDFEDLPGNAGLYDQRLALQWVRENINMFGGDPKKVTLFGESAGASSISLHMLSKESKNLFKNVILESASALSPWTILPIKEARRRTIKLARACSCANATDLDIDQNEEIDFSSKLVQEGMLSVAECLRQVPPQDLVDIEMNLEVYGTARFPSGPVIDNRFIKADPHLLLKRKSLLDSDVNIMAGFNNNEGNYFLVYGSPGFNLTSGSKINRNEFLDGLKMALKLTTDGVPNDQVVLLAEAADFVYTGGQIPKKLPPSNTFDANKTIDGGLTSISYFPIFGRGNADVSDLNRYGGPADAFYRNRLDDMVGDLNFICPTLNFLNRVLDKDMMNGVDQNRELYLYNFVHRSSNNPWPEWMGVMHGYEIEFVFGLPLDITLNYTPREVKLSLEMMELWANFAKHGDPNGQVSNVKQVWRPYTALRKNIFILGDSSQNDVSYASSMYSRPFKSQLHHCSFWDTYFPKMMENLGALSKQALCVPPVLYASTGVAVSLRLEVGVIFVSGIVSFLFS